MALRDIKTKYGRPNLKNQEAINLAIREELVGGNYALEGLTLINQCARSLADKRGPEWSAQQAAALHAREACLELKAVMEAEIRRRYEAE